MTADGAVAFVAGLVLLVLGAELLVRGGTRLAKSVGVRPLVIGLTVVAIGTSTPELAVGITASLQGRGAMAVGNIAGTNVFNILFILGLTALIRPLPLHMQTVKLDLPMIVVAATLMTALAWDGVLGHIDGAIMLGAAAAYTAMLLRVARLESPAVQREFRDMSSRGAHANRRGRGLDWPVSSSLLTIGIALTVVGSNLLVSGAVDIATAVGVSDAVIGLTIVAIGTSSPELVTTVVATLRDERDVAVGNLLGSSIYNILVIFGLTCLVAPEGLPVDRTMLLFDIPLMAGVALACIPVFVTGTRVSRAEGALFLALYAAYLLMLLFLRT